ncbi:MAG: LbtU family siderophore porin [Gammaproteobacteria bacterium]|nr:LbtU family siderophore porin [Gammaproteobacteria bacterium]MDH5803142.1 LbtU family siderophore porin [Gammaproteobacteria bacterium]
MNRNSVGSKLVLGSILGGLALGAEAAENRDWTRTMSISGVVEVEANMGTEDTVDVSGVALATVEIGIETQINENVSAQVVMLHEDPDTWEVDTGTITMKTDMVDVLGGRQYVPFGAFESHMVSDPLTLELAETREAAFLFSTDMGPLSASFYVFNGDSIDTSGEDTLSQYGASVSYSSESESMNYGVGFDYISSFADSDGLQDALDFAGGTTLTSYVAGYAVHGRLEMGDLSVFGEYVTAMDKFDPLEIAHNGGGATPSAMGVEVGYKLGDDTVAAGYQHTAQALALGLPEYRFLFAYSFSPADRTTVSVEYMQTQQYSSSVDGELLAGGAFVGSGNSDSMITVQMAVEF